MKVMAIGDLHDDVDLARRLAEQAEKAGVEVVVVCGDITNGDKPKKGILSCFKQKILLVPGNHESSATVDFLSKYYKGRVINLHGYGYVFKDNEVDKSKGVGFFGCGHGDIGLFRVSDYEIMQILKKGVAYLKGCNIKVMVTHLPPKGTAMDSLSIFVGGSGAVREAIDAFKPDILLCSHIHEAEGIEERIGNTTVVNVGKEGRIFEV